MTERKNIDRLFQEKFKDFEAAPADEVWKNIEARLKEKKKRRVIPLWWKLSGVAALLVLGLLLWNSVNNKSQKPADGVVVTQPETLEKPSINVNPSMNPVSGQQQSEQNNAGDKNTETGPSAIDPAIPSQLVLDEPKSIPDKPEADRKNNHPKKLLRERFENNRSNRVATVINGNGKTRQNQTAGSVADKNSGTDANAATASENNPKQTNPGTKIDDVNPNSIRQNSNDVIESEIVGSRKQQVADNEPDRSGNNLSEGIINSHITPDSSKVGDVQIAETTPPKQDTAKTAVPDSMEELLKEKESAVAVTERKVDRWQVSSNVAPIYFSSIANGSPIDPRFKDNKKTYKPSMSYGVGVQYAVSDRFSVRTGLNALNLEYNTTGVLISQTPEARKLENVKPNMRGQMIQVDNEPYAATMNLGRTISQFSGSLTQSTGYIEIPVEMSYKLLNKKFGVELIGGFSTLFLNKNDVSIASSGMEVSIGEAENLNKMHFSTNVGVGFRYRILKSLHATVEPVFKYQINTFSNDAGDFKPYFFGVYSGLNYRF